MNKVDLNGAFCIFRNSVNVSAIDNPFNFVNGTCITGTKSN